VTTTDGRARRAQTLFIDADDTLWENNVFFERVVAEYCRLVAEHGIDPKRATETLLGIERMRTKTHGYGIDNFARALRLACQDLLGDAHEAEAAVLDELAYAIRRERMTLLPGVAATLRELGGRHRVVLMTKGHRDDQLGKLQRSGLGHLLHDVDVVREKDEATYRDALLRHGAKPELAWMVGNSPRSDILPALGAGLGAVYVPHDVTWSLELSDLPSAHPRLIVLRRFEELTALF
jgi:putative hydrolase of the HAD superfamily